MKIKVYQSVDDKYIEMDVIARYRYIDENYGISLTKNKIYNCVGIEGNELRIVDDTNEDYLFSIKSFELVEKIK